MLQIASLKCESTTPNHRRRPNTIKLLAPVTSNPTISALHEEHFKEAI
jgi:hypothetical protein